LNAIRSKIIWAGGKVEGDVNSILSKEEGTPKVSGKHNVIAFDVPFVEKLTKKMTFKVQGFVPVRHYQMWPGMKINGFKQGWTITPKAPGAIIVNLLLSLNKQDAPILEGTLQQVIGQRKASSTRTQNDKIEFFHRTQPMQIVV